MKCGKQGYYTKNYRQDQRTNIVKGTSMLYNKEKLKGIKEYIIKSFAFYYNNYYSIYQEVKYSISYQLQELKSNILRGTEEANLLQKID